VVVEFVVDVGGTGGSGGIDVSDVTDVGGGVVSREDVVGAVDSVTVATDGSPLDRVKIGIETNAPTRTSAAKTALMMTGRRFHDRCGLPGDAAPAVSS
jgi:hypothetical protein